MFYILILKYQTREYKIIEKVHCQDVIKALSILNYGDEFIVYQEPTNLEDPREKIALFEGRITI